MIDMQPKRLQAVQDLTREYASYSQHRSGLGNVLGGVAGLLAYFVGLLYGPSATTAVVTGVATLGWFVGKEVIRRRVYQAFGTARAPWAATDRRFQLGLCLFLGAISLWVLFVQVQAGRLTEPRFWPYMLIVALMPLIAWRFLRTTSEFIVGVFLLAASAVTSVGGAYTLGGAALSPDNGLLFVFVPIAAVALIVLGLAEHRQFLTLRDQLRAHQEEQADGDDA
jgi:drug/metabolite transporter (DMT)-like permease